MRVTIEVVTGLMMGRRFDLDPAGSTVFGRSPEATVCLVHDREMADRHFVIDCSGPECRIRALSPAAPILVNGQEEAEAVLTAGARFAAGRTTFVAVRVDPPPAPPPRPRPPVPPPGVPAAPIGPRAPAAPPPPRTAARTGPELLEWLGVDEAARGAAAPGRTGPEMVADLAERGFFGAAARLRAHLLGPRAAVRWGCLCVKKRLGGAIPRAEEAAFAAAERWAADPTEPNRRAAGAAAEAAGRPGTATWLATAAFWSGGSLLPPKLPPVPPDERLAGQAVTTALTLAAVRDPPSAAAAWRSFLAMAADLA